MPSITNINTFGTGNGEYYKVSPFDTNSFSHRVVLDISAITGETSVTGSEEERKIPLLCTVISVLIKNNETTAPEKKNSTDKYIKFDFLLKLEK